MVTYNSEMSYISYNGYTAEVWWRNIRMLSLFNLF